METWRILAVSAALCIALRPCLSQESGERIVPPVPIYKVSPKHPPALYDKAIEGEATIVVTVDKLGSVLDPEVESASREEFGIAAMLAAAEWIFEPATRNGEPIEIHAKLPFAFEIAFEHKMNVAFGRAVYVELDIPVHPSSELDQEPLPSFVPAFADFYPKAFKGSGKSASVKLEFVISPTGHVLNPEILSISTKGFEHAALRAVSSMKYNPILIDGEAAYVSIIRPIQIAE